ncbi:MAG: hypothetical protein ACI9TB_000727, partial [Parasphingorhabdus sp.]
GMAKMPRRGDKAIWQHTQDYWAESKELPKVDLDAEEFVYGGVEAKMDSRQVEPAE